MRAPVAALTLFTVAVGQTPPQDGRAALQEAYQRWHKADPNLERDATSAGATLGARADKVAAEAAKYFDLRKSALDNRAADARRGASLLEPLNVAPDAFPNLDRFLTVQETMLRSSINTISAEPDRAIQQLRSSLERERNALSAVATAVKDSQKTQEVAVETSRSAETARLKASEDDQNLALSLQESAELAEKFGVDWAGYYRALSDAARAAAAPITSSGPALPSTGRTANSVDPGKPNLVSGVSGPETRSPAPIPLVRFVGGWTYPTQGAHYHGTQPEWVALTVKEENGRGSGTLTARFRLAPGSTDNPLVRFDFSGAFVNSRVQTLAITSPSGETGTLELIPGPAFNLLEVNFTIGDKSVAKPGTIRQGNFLLVKQ